VLAEALNPVQVVTGATPYWGARHTHTVRQQFYNPCLLLGHDAHAGAVPTLPTHENTALDRLGPRSGAGTHDLLQLRHARLRLSRGSGVRSAAAAAARSSNSQPSPNAQRRASRLAFRTCGRAAEKKKQSVARAPPPLRRVVQSNRAENSPGGGGGGGGGPPGRQSAAYPRKRSATPSARPIDEVLEKFATPSPSQPQRRPAR
jgi:hypothetical protein